MDATSTPLGTLLLDGAGSGVALDLLPVAVAVWGRDGRPTHLNLAARELFGMQSADASLPRFRDSEGNALQPHDHPALTLLRSAASALEHELLLERDDGQVVAVRSRLRLVRDPRQDAVAVVDVCEPRTRLDDDGGGDARRERDFAAIADDLPFLLWRADPAGGTVMCNRRLWEYTGLVRGPSRPDWISALDIAERPRVRALWRQAVASGTTFCTEVRVRRFDSSLHWFLARAWPVRRSGEIDHWLGTCVHIDDHKRLEFELRRCNEELASFAQVASHDLQEPLRMVANFLDLLRRRCHASLDGLGREYLSFAHDGARRMQELVRKLLEYARIGRGPMPSAPIEVATVAHEVLLNLATAISDHQARIEVGPLPAVRVERTQLVQVLQNLVANALNYRSSEAPLVRIDAERAGDFWEFRVIDNGIGIAAADQQRIFGLFQRLHSQGEVPGSGIGLAVCKKIVENHGGRIWVSSEPGKGSCFHFTLPVV
jgi:signal transduction histidine kinase